MLKALEIAGEAMVGLVSNLAKLADGSSIAVIVDKPMYYAGEVVTGQVVALINSPCVCDSIVLKVMAKEKIHWDDEIVRTEWEGEGEQRHAVTTYEHHRREAKEKVFKQEITVSKVDHLLPPGKWIYPFSFQIPAAAPGSIKIKRKERFQDPARRDAEKELKAEVYFVLKAVLETAGIAGRELKASQQFTLNSFYDFTKLAPQAAETSGTVRLLCCIPRGTVTLAASFNKALFYAGEQAGVRCTITNSSDSAIDNMVVKLTRMMTIHDQAKNHSRHFSETMATAVYPGVEAKQTTTRDLPLLLKTSHGDFLPSVQSKRIQVAYKLEIEASVPCAPDIELHFNVAIANAPPAVWGAAALPGGFVYNPADFRPGPGAVMAAVPVPPPMPGAPVFGAAGGAGAMPGVNPLMAAGMGH